MKHRERVTRVIDGDTFKTSCRKHSVRLANVDAPERGKLGAAKATASLRSLIGGEKVKVSAVARDKYARTVANVKVGAKSVNQAMRKKGYK